MQGFTRIRPLVLVFGLFSMLVASAQDKGQNRSSGGSNNVLPVQGRLTDGERKLDGCEVLVYHGNELTATIQTGKSGRFNTELPIGHNCAMEFRRDGFMPKRVLVDTNGDFPNTELLFLPVVLDISLIPMEKYEGADIDVLDFPYAIIRFDKREGVFKPQTQYTSDMMRTNGALLLMAGRATKD